MTDAFLEQLSVAWPPPAWQDVTVVVCVSGGADSVALLCGLASLHTAGSGQLVVAHFNHRWRGGESDADQTFTTELAQRLGLRFQVGTSPEASAETSEASARDARYAFFKEVAKQQGARFVVTAHTADDQVETILHRILRGTGLSGLGGIPRTRPMATGITVLRPLLTISRHSLCQFLETLCQAHREDSSNQETRFTRNQIRTELLPQLRQNYNPRVDEAILRLGQLAADSQHVLQAFCAEIIGRCVTAQGPNQVQLGLAGFVGLPKAAQREVLVTLWKHLNWPQQEMGFQQWDQLAELLQADTNACRQTLPGNICATRHDQHLELVRR